MLTTINEYTYKSFKNYSGPSEDIKFKQKNIFFGYNGKGKSALSLGILEELKKDDKFNKNNYRFFNKDYIKNNLLLEDNKTLKGIVANFGQKDVNLEEEIKEKTNQLKDISIIEQEKEKIEENINKEIDDIFTSKKGNSTIKKKSSNDINDLLSQYSKDLDPALKLVKEKDNLRNVKNPSEYEHNLDEVRNLKIVELNILNVGEIDELSRIINSNYGNNEIPIPEVLEWLQKGLNIHKKENSKVCKFCGGSLDLNSIEDNINKFLSDKKQQDLIKLNTFSVQLKNLIDSKENINNNRLLFNKIVGIETEPDFNDILNSIETINKIYDVIKIKQENFESAIDFDSKKLVDASNNIINNINKIKNKQSEKDKELSKMLEKSNILIKGSIALSIEENKQIKEKLGIYNSKCKELEDSIKFNFELNKKINILKSSKSTTSDFALFINDLLVAFEVDFVIDIHENNYIIKNSKDDQPILIDDISEGENNLLALLLFYYELFNDKEQKDFKNEINTIIIDDPISSLDDTNKIYVIELLKKILELDKPQIFMFTHVWEDFCNICYGKEDKVNTLYRFYEIKKDNKGSYLVTTKTNQTPYMHDFNEIYEFSKKDNANDLDDCAIYHYPNVMRKVLENFMKFKVRKSEPTRNNIDNVKLALCGNTKNVNNKDNIQIPALLDVCNIMSHKSIRNPEEILKSAKYLMDKIRNIDPNHFSNMTNP